MVKQAVPSTAPDGGDQPAGLRSRIRELVSILPGAGFAEDQIHHLEDALLRDLKARLDRLEPPSRRGAPPPARDAGGDGAAPYAPPAGESAPEKLARLMEQSTTQKKDEADDAVYARLLDALLPDEVRMLAALSDGEPHALVDLGLGPPVGPLSQRLARNLSAIGRTAQLRALDHVPHYINHMRSLGLVQVGPGMRELDVKYQIIENDRPVLELIKEIKQQRGKNPRFARRTLRISALGRRLWDACQVGLDDAALGWGEE